MAYAYTDKTLQSENWPEPTQAAVLWERAKHWEQQARYWAGRAISAERRMLEHECSEEGN
ncbi:MAG: hypothetical protein ACTICQ_10380 [Glutamicibacter arilaitensis]|uniref:hypothetical protein n=1 Tax=Glutamicibacter arilaitensis TaxID=256701 RepID=UPI003FB67112